MHRVVEFALAVTIMVFFSGSNFYFVFLGINPDIAPDELAQFDGVIVKFFLLCYVLIAIMTVCFWQSALKGMIVLWPFGVVVAMAWLSLAWSIDPSVTSRRSLALTMTYLYALVLFARFDFDEILKILISGLGIIMLGSLVAVVALPEFAVHGDGDHAGAWRGLFAQKNAAGRTMIWLMIAIIAAWLTGRIHRGMLAIVGSLTLLFIAATTSKTALLGLTAALMVGPLIVTARKKTLTSALIVLAMLSMTLIVAVVVSFTYEDILLSMGRDPTLTGRTEIWGFTLDLLQQRWLTGFGYEVFWASDFGPGGRYRVDWGIASAHNSWIDIMLSFGPLGAVIMVAIIAACACWAATLARYATERGASFFVGAVLLVTTIISMSESIFMERHSVHTIIFMVAFGVARVLSQRLWSPAPLEATPLQPAYAGAR